MDINYQVITSNPSLLVPLSSFLIGWLLDRLFGDPERLPHPVVLFGKMIAKGERMLNLGKWRVLKGALLAVMLITVVVFATWTMIVVADKVNIYLGMAMRAILVFYCLAGTTLIREVRQVFYAIDSSLDEGRQQVARIVGRDTSELTDEEVRKAALETLAENLNDGVIAPLFWFAIGGVPAMMGYKMVNTLDSMIAYHSPRYLKFGKAAARIDDIANYIPARLTALLMLIAARRLNLVSFVMKYGPCHASPNSGWPEAALAGILGCRFGGPHKYFGETFDKPYIGNQDKPLTREDMEKAVRINRTAETLGVIIIILLLFV
ncbi:MAG: adenosylcobinamide-phosphate synthase CbiB [Prevotella sp.]|nr:adenosylcobinamide-phosphate synthase CbiB [Prevotella sp.]